MEIPVSYLLNGVFAWLIVILAIAGYFITLRRLCEKWVFWVVLAIGWSFFAICHTLLIAGVSVDVAFLSALWLASYVLVMASLVLLFIKIIGIKKGGQPTAADSEDYKLDQG